MHKNISYARLQTEAYLPQVGGLGTVFPPNQGSKTLKDLTMAYEGHTLSISFEYLNLKHEILVPMGNVVLMKVDHSAK